MRSLKSALFAALALAMVPATAPAHALLQKAAPPVGSTVKSSPSEIRIWFSEGVEPAFSGVTLATSGGAAVPVGKAAVEPKDHAVMVVKVGRKLAPGTYKVDWHAVAIDTHRTQGSFTFSVE